MFGNHVAIKQKAKSRERVCMYVSMLVCMFVRTYGWMYACTSALMYMYACVHECIHVCMNGWMYACVCLMYVFMYAWSMYV